MAYFLLKSCETKTNASDKALSTHYYNNQYEACKRAIIDIANRNGYNIIDINDNYHEIFIEFPKGDLIFTLIEKTPSVTSIDIKINTTYGIAFGRTYKFLQQMFEDLSKRLNLLKVGGTYGA